MSDEREIVIQFKLEDGRFCNGMGLYSDNCPCLIVDDLYGDPEGCRLGYSPKIKYYNATKGDFRDDLGIEKYSGYPYGYLMVAIRPAECISRLGGGKEESGEMPESKEK